MAPFDQGREQSIWLSLPTVVTVALVLALARLYVSAHSGLAFDEGYYTFWSLRLAVGYLDHPPAVAWLIAIGRGVFGDSELGVRAMAVVCGLGVTAAIYRIGVLLLDRRTAALAAIWFSLTPLAGVGFLMTPDPPSVLFWSATLWAVAEFISSRNANWWLAAGVFAGLGLWSKYTVGFLAFGLLLFILTSRERRQWLTLWQVWAGAVLAPIVFSPVIWWNAQHNWASFRFQGQRTVVADPNTNALANYADLLASQSLFVVPILFVLAITGMILYLRRPNAPSRAALALPVCTSLPLIAYFLYHALHGQVDGNWPAPLWPILSLPAAWVAVSLMDRLRTRRLAWSLVLLQIGLGIGITGLIYTQLLYQPFALDALDRTRETRGWAKLQKAIGDLAHANSAKWIATRTDYGLTGQLATYFRFANAPLPVRQIDEPLRWAYLPPLDADALGWPAMFVRIERDPDAPQAPSDLFGEAKLVGVVRRDGGRGPLEAYSAFVVSQPTAAFFAGLH